MAAICPSELGPGGRTLWLGVAEGGDLDPVQLVNLLEACRQKDRLDKLDAVLRGEVDVWVRLLHNVQTEDYEIRVDDALAKANATANQMKQHLAALRLPDKWGVRPQQRGGARGVYAPGGDDAPADSPRVKKAASSGRSSARDRLSVVGGA